MLEQGLLLSIVGLSVVFFVLIINYFLIKFMGLFTEKPEGSTPKKKAKVKSEDSDLIEDSKAVPTTTDISPDQADKFTSAGDPQLIHIIMAAIERYETEMERSR